MKPRLPGRPFELFFVVLVACLGPACAKRPPLANLACGPEEPGPRCGPGWRCCSEICIPNDATCEAELCARLAAARVDASAIMTESVPDAGVTISQTSCLGDPNGGRVIDEYSKGYVQEQRVLDRVRELMAGMSLEDKVLQMYGLPYRGEAASDFFDIQRSQPTATIREFRYRDGPRGLNLGENIDAHTPNATRVDGVDVGFSTVFPVSIARGASFDIELEHDVGEAIGDEVQAIGDTILLAPCLNVLRHPLWGRAQETYGEDSFLTGRLGSAMTVGIQEHVAAAAKHFIAYDIEHLRDGGNSQLDEQSLREAYGRHFRMVVQDGGVGVVMASYNSVNGLKATQNKHLLTDVLRADFGFKGFVISDWWAMPNRPDHINQSSRASTGVEAIKAGLDVEVPWDINFGGLADSVRNGEELTASEIDAAVARILEQKVRFNADNRTGPTGRGSSSVRLKDDAILCDSAHDALARKAAFESMVLLKNDGATLPIKEATKVAVLGASVVYPLPNSGRKKTKAMNFATDVVTGDAGSSRAFPDPHNSVSPFNGIVAAAPDGVEVWSGTTAADAKDADFVVVVAGLTAHDEGELYTDAGDRSTLELDGKRLDTSQSQTQLIADVAADVAARNKRMVVVLIGGSVIDMPWLDRVPAVVMAWYPGQAGGAALGKLLFGKDGGSDVTFSGKLPLTWAKSLADYPLFKGPDNATVRPSEIPGPNTPFDYYVGYRHFDQAGITPLFPFGHGLSYTSFAYRAISLDCGELGEGGVLPVKVTVENTGAIAGDEIVMAFASFPGTQARRPEKELKGFARVHLEAGEQRTVSIPIRVSDLDYFRMDDPSATTGRWVVESGDVTIRVGPNAATLPLTATVKVNGYASSPR